MKNRIDPSKVVIRIASGNEVPSERIGKLIITTAIAWNKAMSSEPPTSNPQEFDEEELDEVYAV